MKFPNHTCSTCFWAVPSKRNADERRTGTTGLHGDHLNMHCVPCMAAETRSIPMRDSLFTSPRNTKFPNKSARMRPCCESNTVDLKQKRTMGRARTGRQAMAQFNATSPHQRIGWEFGFSEVFAPGKHHFSQRDKTEPAGPPLYDERKLTRD